jgi:ABC-type glycerol-3-phosphate transport system substrate-binding protein
MVQLKISKKTRNVLIALAAIILLFVITSLIPEKDFSEKYEGVDLSVSAVQGETRNYSQYLAIHSDSAKVTSNVKVDVLRYDTSKSTGVSLYKSYYGKDAVFTDDDSSITWNVEVPAAGFYNLEFEYIATPSRNVNLERSILINGESPFNDAESVFFSRLWQDGGPIKTDNRGNSIRPVQKETFAYQTARVKSHLGYEVDPYLFYFNKGNNTITVKALNEPMVISRVTLAVPEVYKTYKEYLAGFSSKPEDETKDEYIKVQGEDSVVRSDPSLFARYDHTSATTQPYSLKTQVLNYVGSDAWKDAGQWIEWNVEVPSDGWYTLTIKGRQLFQRGYVSCRSVYIDGKIPVDSLKVVRFPYSTDWVLNTVSDEEGNPLNFYFTQGSHTIRIEATLGEMGNIIRDLQDCIFRLNKIYRTILVLTGTVPDPNRDYEIDRVYPNEVNGMLMESKRLYAIVDRFVEMTGQKSNLISPAEALAIQLEQFYERPEKITKAFQNFKDNITSLGTSLLTMQETKLDIDYIALQSSNQKLKKDSSNFFKNARHEIASFFTSFFVDTTNFGNVYDKDAEHTIQVWIIAGRDQSELLKTIVDDSFTPEYGVNVNLKLIAAESLLNAIMAGNGPDVVVTLYNSAPVDYALRNGNINLKRFPDCDEVLKCFKPSSYEAYRYDGGLYALPEKANFNLLFYRKDILEQLELEVPKTWEDLINMLPTLQGNNLNVGIPYPNIVLPDMTTFYSMIYQQGGAIYNEKGSKSIIDSEPGIKAFKLYTSFFNDYGLPTIYDFLSRFRTGEMPIGIAPYSTYNTLAVSAPEIRGLWDISYMLGTKQADGSINRLSMTTTECTMMVKKGKDLDDYNLPNAKELIAMAMNGEPLPEAAPTGIDAYDWKEVRKNEVRIQDAWKFMKWWLSTDIQVRFGREQEAIIGASGRYTTANVEALKQLPWRTAELRILSTTFDETIGIPEVPGSYYTPRHVVNAVRKIVNEQEDTRETLIDYTRKINEELIRKRQEFNLPLDE